MLTVDHLLARDGDADPDRDEQLELFKEAA